MTAATLPSFQLPSTFYNNHGWGPSSATTASTATTSASSTPSPSTVSPVTSPQQTPVSPSVIPSNGDARSISELFLPYTKNDRLGRISDFTQVRQEQRHQQRLARERERERELVEREGSVASQGSGSGAGQVSNLFSYRQDRMGDDGDGAFTLVGKDLQAPQHQKKGYTQYNRQRYPTQLFTNRANNMLKQQSAKQQQGQQGQGGQPQRAWGGHGGSGGVVGSKPMGMSQQTTSSTRSGTINVSARQLAVSARQAAYMANRAKQRFHQQQDNEVQKENSIPIQAGWQEVGELNINELQNITAECTAVDDLSFNGVLEKYNNALNRVTPRQPVTLQRIPDNKLFITATTSEDPALLDYMNSGQGNVYATDSILSILMSATRTINSFDIIIRKQDGRIILDKRHGSRIDYLSVGENIPEQNIHHATPTITDPEHINHPDNLSAEATFINQCFSQQILAKDGEKHEFQEPNPFADSGVLPDGSELASLAYRYRKFTLPGGNELVVRCTLNAYTDVSGSTPLSSNQDPISLPDGRKRVFVISRALNEYDSKHSNSIDYRQKLEQQAGAVIASEIKNNLAKLSRWTAEAILTGAEQVRIGFVSRLNPKSNLKHQLLMNKLYTPATFAQSLNVPVRQLWGTLHAILQLVNKQPDGTYLLLRDANKPLLRLFKVGDQEFPIDTEAASASTASTTIITTTQTPATTSTALSTTPTTATQ